ncbi:40S ribosomal protein S2 [Cricetulus griseus]|nr:40S ribosomal protein S2 [Cricetulus griseus]
MNIKSLEEIYLFSLLIKDEVLKIVPAQKQTQVGQRTRLRAFVAIGDYNGHVGLGIKCSKEVVIAIRGTLILAKLSLSLSSGIFSAPEPKRLLMTAGIDDCSTSARDCNATLGNFAKVPFDAISKTYSYLILDLWKETVLTKSPYQEFTDHLVKSHTRVSVQRTQVPAVATT